MAAALGEILVLELDGVGAGALELANGTDHVERVAVAGVGVDDEMGIDAIANERQCLGHFGHADQADVRPAKPGVGDGGPGDVKRSKAHLRRHQRSERIVDAGCNHDGLLLQARFQGFGFCHDHIPR